MYAASMAIENCDVLNSLTYLGPVRHSVTAPCVSSTVLGQTKPNVVTYTRLGMLFTSKYFLPQNAS